MKKPMGLKGKRAHSTGGAPRIAIVVSHPIQHFCPQYRSLARRVDVDVLVVFASMHGLTPYHDRDFGRLVDWGEDIVDGFNWVDAKGSAATIGRVLNEYRPDWVVTYGHHSTAARTALAWTMVRRTAKLAYIADSEMRHLDSAVRQRLRLTALRPLFKRVDAFLTVGDANEEFYTAAGADPARFVRMNFPIAPAMTTAAGDSGDRGKLLRARLGIHPNALVVGSVGKLIERKRHAELLTAAAAFRPEDLHVVIVGSGELEPQLAQQASSLSNATLVGFLHPTELPALYGALDVYVHLSDYDPHPLAVSEAAAAGCALVVSRSIGSWGHTDDVQPFSTGFVVETGAVDALVNALTTLAAHRDLVAEYGARASRNLRPRQLRAHGEFLLDLLQR